VTDTWTWATVTQATPLRIKVDGDTSALDATTDNLVGSLAVDDRVRVHLHADGIIVTGLQGGYPTPLVFSWLGTPNASESVLRTVGGTEVRRNLIANPSIETNITGWLNYASQRVLSTAQAYLGASSLLVTHNGTAAGGVYTPTIAITGGKAYTVSAYIKDVDSAVQYQAKLTFSGAPVAGSSTTVTSGGWTRITATGVAPAVATSVRATFYAVTTPAADTSFYLDAVMLEESSTLGDYFDGSQYPAQVKQVATVEYVQALIAAL